MQANTINAAWDIWKKVGTRNALKAFDEAIRSVKADADRNWLAEIHFQKASVYYALEEFEKAISEYKETIAHNSKPTVFYNALGISALRTQTI